MPSQPLGKAVLLAEHFPIQIPRHRVSSLSMVAQLANAIPLISEICRAHGVRRLWLFGSATGRSIKPFTSESDLDLLVEFDESASLARGLKHPLFTLPDLIEQVVGRRVQITENVSFENPYFRDNVMSTRELIYDAEHQQAAVGHPSVG